MDTKTTTSRSRRTDIITTIAVIGLVAVIFLIPVTRDFVATSFEAVFTGIGHAATAVAHLVASIFGGGAA